MACSLAINPGVPTTTDRVGFPDWRTRVPMVSFTAPKSSNTGSKLLDRNIILSGLMSRWTICRLWTYSRTDSKLVNIARTLLSRIGLWVQMYSARV
ncbi:hypothetical protein AY599_18865 [Leptolyngbya valderiana BDU 20041]|nr:hypothetical protein AY599_18865 [Leptolyngbya valderiana BDU 20041]